MKRLTAVLLTILTALCLAVFVACNGSPDLDNGDDNAANSSNNVSGENQSSCENVYGYFTVTENIDGKLTVTGLSSSFNQTELDIPAKLNGKPVFGIRAGAFNGHGEIKRVSIASTIKYIDETAFSGMTGLTAIEASGDFYFTKDGVLYNFNGALLHYPVAKTDALFSIPESVKDVEIKIISKNAFAGAKNLTGIDFGKVAAIADGAFGECTNLVTLINASKIEYVSASAFAGTPVSAQTADFITIGKVLLKYNGQATELTESDFPEEILRIASSAFSGNSRLEKIYLPMGIEYIDDNAFENCENLKNIRYINYALPKINSEVFVNLHEDFKFYITKYVIDQVSENSSWFRYKALLQGVATKAYFIDLDKYVDLYYGEIVTLPSEKVDGWYNKGWQRLAANDNPFGEYLTPGIWTETAETVNFKADLIRLENYTIVFNNGGKSVGSMRYDRGDNCTVSRLGYSVNGVEGAFSGKTEMDNCAVGSYYGSATVEGNAVAVFKGWEINGKLLTDGIWDGYYSDGVLEAYAVWEPLTFTVTLDDGNGGITTHECNYFDGLVLPVPDRDGFTFLGWQDSDGEVYNGTLNPNRDFSLTPKYKA